MRIESQVVLAGHKGSCGSSCRDPIWPGEPMQKVGGRWFHEECVPNDAEPFEATTDEWNVSPSDRGEGEGPS